MPGKKDRKKKPEQDGESKIRQLLKRELMKWYCRTLYSGRIKACKNNSSCSAKKA
ncbi:MAG: hypothetical protein K6T65_06510 [Peptococcaceae bacterium]|nr:hypothetical protein [Peptococcaceae bacterium]